MTRIPGDFPNEGRAHAQDRRNTQSRPGAPVFEAPPIGTHLRCPACGNQVRVEEIGGGEIRCSCGPMQTLDAL
jgi:hypothetical protein